MSVFSDLNEKIDNLQTDREREMFVQAARIEDAMSGPFSKDLDYPSRPDMLRPNPENFRGLVEGRLRTGIYPFPRINERRWWNSFNYDPDISGMSMKIARKVCMLPWRTIETTPGQGDPLHYQLLTDFFRYPNIRHTFGTILRVIAVRLKVVGRAYLRLIRRGVTANVASQITNLFGEAILTVLKGNYGDQLCKQMVRNLEREMETLITDKTAVGFEWLQGQVDPLVDKRGNFIDTDRAYLQTVAYGQEWQFFPEEDIIPFENPHPQGGVDPLSEVRLIEPYSDADLSAFYHMKEFMRGAAAAQKVVMVRGLSRIEFAKLKFEALRRADMAAADEKWLPIFIRAHTRDAADTNVVDLHDEIKSDLMEPWFDRNQLRKSEVLNVSTALMGRPEKIARGNMDALREEAAEEVNSIASLIRDTINMKIILDVFGYTDHEMYYQPMTTRKESERNAELEEDLKSGVLTPRAYVERRYDKRVAESLPEEWRDRNLLYTSVGIVPVETAIEEGEMGQAGGGGGGDGMFSSDQGEVAPEEGKSPANAERAADESSSKVLKALQRWEDLESAKARGQHIQDEALRDAKSHVPADIGMALQKYLSAEPSPVRIHKMFREAKEHVRKVFEARDDILDVRNRDQIVDGLLAVHEDRL